VFLGGTTANYLEKTMAFKASNGPNSLRVLPNSDKLFVMGTVIDLSRSMRGSTRGGAPPSKPYAGPTPLPDATPLLAAALSADPPKKEQP